MTIFWTSLLVLGALGINGARILSPTISIVTINEDNQTFSPNDLIRMHYTIKSSSDIDVDICKASGFRGDIAEPKIAARRYSAPIAMAAPQPRRVVKRRRPAKKTRGRKPLRKQRRMKRYIEEGADIMRGVQRRTHRPQRAAIAKPEKLWKHAIIPYEIESNFTGDQRALFKQAMQHWENHTCIKFIERDSAASINRALNHTDYILFTIRPCGCCSYVGRRGNGPQAISIGRNCDTFGVVVHEIGHVIGFYHEQARPDRDQHVRVLTNNIAHGSESNFHKMNEFEINSHGQAYDLESIMHYSGNQLARETGLQTIQVLDEHVAVKIGQRRRLSEGDVTQANILYKCAKCGHTMQDAKGTFEAPLSVGPVQCEWRITATVGERIHLRLANIALLSPTDCLEVRDGSWIGSPVLQKLCGHVGAESGDIILLSVTNRMSITLKSANQPQPTVAFTASYEFICGGDLHVNENSGRIESPNYPDAYLTNKDCVWRLSVPTTNQIALQFQSFDIEQHATCAFDSLEIRDGPAEDSPLLGTFCGFNMPDALHSSGQHMWVRFRSDNSTQRAGFSAQVIKERDECALGEHSCEHGCVNTMGSYRCTCTDGFDLHSNQKTCETSCGRTIDLRTTATPTGTIVSPSFPDLYPSNRECVWEILSPKSSRITLNFTHFDLEDYAFQTHDCDADSLTIESADTAGRRIQSHGVHCGARRVSPVLSQTDRLRLVFRSDRTIQKSGFALIYGLDVNECAHNNGGCMHQCTNTMGSFECSCKRGSTLHENGLDCVEGGCQYEMMAATGVVTSPNWPHEYPAEAQCRWHFRTLPGHRVQFVFDRFELEMDDSCAYDRVTFYNGATTDAFTLAVFCEGRQPNPVHSSTNDLLLEFHSDSSGQRAGFHGTHSTICGGQLVATAKAQQVYSHVTFGEAEYDVHESCEWLFMAPEGQVVLIEFEEFELEEQAECEYDYVEVYDGEDEFDGKRLGKFCGTQKPATIVSAWERAMLRFRSDGTHQKKGFVINYTAVYAKLV